MGKWLGLSPLSYTGRSLEGHAETEKGYFPINLRPQDER